MSVLWRSWEGFCIARKVKDCSVLVGELERWCSDCKGRLRMFFTREMVLLNCWDGFSIAGKVKDGSLLGRTSW